MAVYLDCERNYSYFNNFIIIFGFCKLFQQIADMDIKSYIKYLYIFYGILVYIFYFKTHLVGNTEARNGESSFKKLIIIREK